MLLRQGAPVNTDASGRDRVLGREGKYGTRRGVVGSNSTWKVPYRPVLVSQSSNMTSLAMDYSIIVTVLFAHHDVRQGVYLHGPKTFLVDDRIPYSQTLRVHEVDTESSTRIAYCGTVGSTRRLE